MEAKKLSNREKEMSHIPEEGLENGSVCKPIVQACTMTTFITPMLDISKVFELFLIFVLGLESHFDHCITLWFCLDCRGLVCFLHVNSQSC